MRVLIVEDDVELAAALDDALRHEGYRTSLATTGTDAYRGYYAGITGSGRVVLGKADNNWTQLASAAVTVRPNTRHHLRGADRHQQFVWPRLSFKENVRTAHVRH